MTLAESQKRSLNGQGESVFEDVNQNHRLDQATALLIETLLQVLEDANSEKVNLDLSDKKLERDE